MTNTKKTVLQRLLVSLLLVLLLIGFDQWTKQIAERALSGGDKVNLIPGVLELVYVRNFGAAFGILQGKRWLFFVIAAVVCVFLFVCIARLPAGRRFLPMQLSFCFIIAGAVGNVIDRAVHVYVTDFIYFVPIDFPVFNVADIYITCSCALLIFLILFYYREDELGK